ncbi:MAG: hypothetical protein LBF72_01960 [Holosporales bacterium]|nr:hypothetical protein [Holosporales bacterium]
MLLRQLAVICLGIVLQIWFAGAGDAAKSADDGKQQEDACEAVLKRVEVYLNGVSALCCNFSDETHGSSGSSSRSGSFCMKKQNAKTEKDGGCDVMFAYSAGQQILVLDGYTMVIKKPDPSGSGAHIRKYSNLGSFPISRIFSREVKLKEHFNIVGYGVSPVIEKIEGMRHAAQAKSCAKRTTRAEQQIDEPANFRRLDIEEERRVLFVTLQPKSFSSRKVTLFFKLYPPKAKSQDKSGKSGGEAHDCNDIRIQRLIGWSVRHDTKKEHEIIDVVFDEETLRVNDLSKIPQSVFEEEKKLIKQGKKKRVKSDDVHQE